MDRGAALPGEERKLLELLVLLIQAYENAVTQEEASDPDGDGEDEEENDTARAPLPRPHETLQRLMEARGWEHDVLVDIFGNPHLVAEILSGRRPISKGQAKALAKLFRVPVKLFVV